jgi:hypothetical protein
MATTPYIHGYSYSSKADVQQNAADIICPSFNLKSVIVNKTVINEYFFWQNV